LRRAVPMTDDSRMSMQEVEWGEPLLPRVRDPELEAIARKGGRVQYGTAAYFTSVPWVYLALVRLNQRLLQRIALDDDLADLAGLVVSQDNSCRYCYAVQRALLRAVGFEEEQILKLEERLLVADLGRSERGALEFARRFSRSNPLVARRELDALHEVGFDPLEIRDLAVMCALTVFFNRTSTIVAIPPYGWEQAPDRWYMPVARPFVAAYVRHVVRRRSRPAWLAEDQKSGPFSYLTNALDGHPLAGELRGILDEMWNSTHLSRRATALCFAVVARALSCPLAEREAVDLAREEGLSAEEVESILAHLSSPRLDAVERALVPFSRQTVWYQVPDLQRRARELREALSTEAFTEAVAVTSLANLVCRLGCVAEPT
jgi:AhpD family alkylhydroperoxidase